MSEVWEGIVDVLEYLKRRISQNFEIQCPVPPPEQPTDQALAAMQKLNAEQADPSSVSALGDGYVTAYGFDPVDKFHPNEPWFQVIIEDLDAVIAVAGLLGSKPEFVLALWIMEGKITFNSHLHSPTQALQEPLTAGPQVSVENVASWMRSIILWGSYGGDAYAPHGPASADNPIAGPDADHDGVFTAKLTQLKANGITLPITNDPSIFLDYCTSMAAFSLTVRDHTTHHIFAETDTIPAHSVLDVDALLLRQHRATRLRHSPTASSPRAPGSIFSTPCSSAIISHDWKQCLKPSTTPQST